MKRKKPGDILVMGREPYAWRALCCAAALFGAGAPHAVGQAPVRTPDYLRDVQTLAGVIGKAHAVRVRCNGRQDQRWRDFMAEMLALEAPDSGRLRSNLVDAYNRNYQRELGERRFCDDDTKAAEAAYAAEGRELSDRLATFYFPKPKTGSR